MLFKSNFEKCLHLYLLYYISRIIYIIKHTEIIHTTISVIIYIMKHTEIELKEMKWRYK